MCTLIVARNMFAFSPLVVIANRDERYDRPAAAPELWGRTPEVLAPVDREGGGTWIGVNGSGVFAGITNRNDVVSREGLTSRGLLVLAALETRDARAASMKLSRTDGRAYNGFRLLIADRYDTYLVSGDGMGVRVDPLRDGLHVATEQGFGDGHCTRAKRVWTAYRRHARHAPPRPPTLGSLLSIHDGESPRDGTCVHMDERGYGTRSSTIIRMNDRGSRFVLWHREGPACAGPFAPPTHLKITAE